MNRPPPADLSLSLVDQERGDPLALLPILSAYYGVELHRVTFEDAICRHGRNGGSYHVAWSGGEPVGVLGMFYQDHPWFGWGCYQLGLAVAPPFRGMGIDERMRVGADALNRELDCGWSMFGRLVSKNPLARAAAKLGYRQYATSWSVFSDPQPLERGECLPPAKIQRVADFARLRAFWPLIERFHAGLAHELDPPLYPSLLDDRSRFYIGASAAADGRPVGLMSGWASWEGTWEGIIDIAWVEDHDDREETTRSLLRAARTELRSLGAGETSRVRLREGDARLAADLDRLGARPGARIFLREGR